MGQGKQAKVLTETQIKAVLAAVDGRRYPKRDRSHWCCYQSAPGSAPKRLLWRAGRW